MVVSGIEIVLAVLYFKIQTHIIDNAFDIALFYDYFLHTLSLMHSTFCSVDIRANLNHPRNIPQKYLPQL